MREKPTTLGTYRKLASSTVQNTSRQGIRNGWHLPAKASASHSSKEIMLFRTTERAKSTAKQAPQRKVARSVVRKAAKNVIAAPPYLSFPFP